jgi:hypothetical protein
VADEDIMRTLAFVVGLCIAAVGAVGLLMPTALIWLARQFLSAGAFAFYIIATVRIALGLILISVASASRAPKAMAVLGYFIFILGITTGITGLMDPWWARGAIEWWLQQAPGAIRLAALLVLALGGFVTYACAPPQRSLEFELP